MGSTLRIGMLCIGALLTLAGIAVAVAASKETEPLRGRDLDQSEELKTYVQAVAKLFAGFGIEAKERTVELRAPALRVHLVEVPGEGTPIVLIHGGGSTLASWAPLLPELRGRHLFLIDRPGCGQSDGFDYRGVDLKRHVLDVMSGVIDALGLEKVQLVGNSMGGLWSIWYAEAHPEKVEALALLGCPAVFPGTSAPFPLRLANVPGLGAAMMSSPPSSAEEMRKQLARVGGDHAASVVDPLVLEAALASNLIPGTRKSFRTLATSVLTLSGARPGVALTDADLSAVRAPMLLVWGRQDAFGDYRFGERARDAHPNVSLLLVEGGHVPWLDDPHQVGQAVRAYLETRGSSVSTR